MVFLASSIYFYKHWIERMCAEQNMNRLRCRYRHFVEDGACGI